MMCRVVIKRRGFVKYMTFKMLKAVSFTGVLILTIFTCGSAFGGVIVPLPEKGKSTVSDKELSLETNGKVSIKVRKRALKDVLQAVQNRSGIKFSVEESLLPKVMDSNVEGEDWDQAVRALLKQYSVIYGMSDGKLVAVKVLESDKEGRHVDVTIPPPAADVQTSYPTGSGNDHGGAAVESVVPGGGGARSQQPTPVQDGFSQGHEAVGPGSEKRSEASGDTDEDDAYQVPPGLVDNSPPPGSMAFPEPTRPAPVIPKRLPPGNVDTMPPPGVDVYIPR